MHSLAEIGRVADCVFYREHVSIKVNVLPLHESLCSLLLYSKKNYPIFARCKQPVTIGFFYPYALYDQPISLVIHQNFIPLSYIKRLLVFLLVIFFGSCVAPKKVIYFQNLQKDTTLHNIISKDLDLLIRKNDVLSIVISSLSLENTLIFNPNVASNSPGSLAPPGYTVDNEGNIQLPKLGLVHVEGMTRNEVKNKLLKDLLPYLKDPLVSIHFQNHQVTILGEVNKPQVLLMPTENLTLLESIALSGDLTLTGRRDNILVIRNTDAGKQFKRLNLNNNSIFYSPFYYLKPEDIVYVEPTKAKLKGSAQTGQILQYAISIISIVLIILQQFKII